jgi:hypothetical protein
MVPVLRVAALGFAFLAAGSIVKNPGAPFLFALAQGSMAV